MVSFSAEAFHDIFSAMQHGATLPTLKSKGVLHMEFWVPIVEDPQRAEQTHV